MSVKHTETDNLPGGVLTVNKPAGMTSHDVVNKIRRLYGTKRVGHAGTLDPLAEGVLVVLVGRAAKACEYISSDSKTYVATMRLGMTTDTEDVTGKRLTSCARIPSSDAVSEACRDFVGNIMQTPPMYSALKINGKKLYELARDGVVVDREPREITVYSIDAEPIADSQTDFKLTVKCSGGTYIRTLCADIGARLGCGGAMASLLRTEACGMSIDDAYSLDEIENMNGTERQSILVPTERLFSDAPAVGLPAFFERLFRNGCAISCKKIKCSLPVGSRVRVCDSNGEFFALGNVAEADGDAVLRSVKIFELK